MLPHAKKSWSGVMRTAGPPCVSWVFRGTIPWRCAEEPRRDTRDLRGHRRRYSLIAFDAGYAFSVPIRCAIPRMKLRGR